ncbi:hypothetical protein BS50DRAFT_147246 [Corynespora cassiicola Philippines]|uniref:Uncharacterized protein n=1 Tax=Corynespora cassiicola Philippines TaxID=1448308 RepID=A0A2T2N8Y6_CORCC|nr:hypothetical protein BS50DRAFT_147246 [Corynespora cassiicola Philippines]
MALEAGECHVCRQQAYTNDGGLVAISATLQSRDSSMTVAIIAILCSKSPFVGHRMVDPGGDSAGNTPTTSKSNRPGPPFHPTSTQNRNSSIALAFDKHPQKPSHAQTRIYNPTFQKCNLQRLALDGGLVHKSKPKKRTSALFHYSHSII